MVEQAVGEGINSRYRCSRSPIAGGISCTCAGPAMHALYGCLLVVPGTGCPPVTQVVSLKLFLLPLAFIGLNLNNFSCEMNSHK